MAKNKLENLTMAGKAIKTTEQAQEMGRKGGIESQKKQKEKKKLREILAMLLEDKVKLDDKDPKSLEVTRKQKMLINYLKKAEKGQSREVEYVIENVDGKLEEFIKMQNEIKGDLEHKFTNKEMSDALKALEQTGVVKVVKK